MYDQHVKEYQYVIDFWWTKTKGVSWKDFLVMMYT